MIFNCILAFVKGNVFKKTIYLKPKLRVVISPNSFISFIDLEVLAANLKGEYRTTTRDYLEGFENNYIIIRD